MRLLTTTAVLALLAVPALAGGSHECQGGHNCNTGGSPAPSSTNVNANLNYNRASSTAAAHAAAASRSSAIATGGSARATGGASSATTGAVTVTNSYTGGATDPAAGYSGGGTYTLRNVPDVTPPSIVGGNPCTVGASGGIGTSGFGLSLGSTWADRSCERRQSAALLYNMGEARAATALLCQDDHIREALKEAGNPCPADRPAPVAQAAPVALAVTNVATVPAPAWCKRARPTTDASRAYVASVCGGR